MKLLSLFLHTEKQSGSAYIFSILHCGSDSKDGVTERKKNSLNPTEISEVAWKSFGWRNIWGHWCKMICPHHWKQLSAVCHCQQACPTHRTKAQDPSHASRPDLDARMFSCATHCRGFFTKIKTAVMSEQERMTILWVRPSQLLWVGDGYSTQSGPKGGCAMKNFPPKALAAVSSSGYSAFPYNLTNALKL